MLVNVPRLVTAYYAERPDPSVAAERVAFGTSGHRGSAFDRTFNESHILAITQAICAYRQMHRIDGPLFIGTDTHALSEPACASALEVLAANGVEVMIDRDRGYTPTPVISHAILRWNHGRTSGLADGIVVTPLRTTRRRTAAHNPPSGGPAATEVTGWDRAARERPARRRSARRPTYAVRARASRREHTSSRLRHAIRRRPGERDRHGGHPSRRRPHRCGSPSVEHRRALLGADHRKVRDHGDRRQRRR